MYSFLINLGIMSSAAAAKHSDADKRICSFCQEHADDDLSITHRVCGARTHVECLPQGKPINYKLCSQCTGEYVPLANVASMDTNPPSGSAGSGREPFPPDGVDYVLNPGIWTVEAPSALKSIAGLFGAAKAAPQEENVRTSQDPHFLIRNRVPIRDVLRYNKLGLQHFLKAGVTMSELLANGYTWNDLLLFEDVGRKGPTRAAQTLSIGLRTTANHFRDYPDALPFAKVKEHAKLQSYDLCRQFGLGFPSDSFSADRLQCDGDTNWTAWDCVRLGLKMDDLQSAGLVLVQQYEDLMVGLSAPDAAAAERELAVRPEHIEALQDAFAAAPPPVPIVAPTPVKAVPVKSQPPPVALLQTQVVDDDDDEIGAPIRAVEQQPQQPQARHPSVRTIAIPVPVAAPVTAPAPIRTKPTVLPAPAFKSLSGNRFDRHGAILAPVKMTK